VLAHPAEELGGRGLLVGAGWQRGPRGVEARLPCGDLDDAAVALGGVVFAAERLEHEGLGYAAVVHVGQEVGGGMRRPLAEREVPADGAALVEEVPVGHVALLSEPSPRRSPAAAEQLGDFSGWGRAESRGQAAK